MKNNIEEDIERLEQIIYIDIDKQGFAMSHSYGKKFQTSISNVLSNRERQKRENEELKRTNIKQSKIIDEMAKMIDKVMSNENVIEHFCIDKNCGYEDCHGDTYEECIKQYFERKVENE